MSVKILVQKIVTLAKKERLASQPLFNCVVAKTLSYKFIDKTFNNVTSLGI